MNKLLKSYRLPLIAFLVWRIALFLLLAIAIQIVPLQQNYLGGGLANYVAKPFLWVWANFDGEHYLSIAQRGYSDLQYFYFPLLPFIVRFIGLLFGNSSESTVVIGIVVSNTAFLIGLLGFWKLLKLDFSETLAKLTIVLLLVFPTSFYFASFYTESLFFALTIWCFYLARTSNWFLSGVTGFFASATRIIGIGLFPALFVEGFLQNKKKIKTHMIWLGLIPLGLLIYMLYLKNTTGDPLEFFNSISVFGQQRSSTFILPPQVVYRYLFKILPNINYNYFPLVFTTLMELIIGVSFLVLAIYSFFKLRVSYSIYLLTGYLMPVFSGSFSSLPRYVLVLFPAFILLAQILVKLPRVLQLVIFGLLFTSLGVAFSLFARGFWVS